MMIPRLKPFAVAALLASVVAAPVRAQAPESPEGRLARTAVEALPIGATVTFRIHDGERLKAVLLSVDETGVRVKPATRVPEPSRRFTYEQIERIDRKQDHVSVGKYAGIGSAIGAGVLFLLLAGI